MCKYSLTTYTCTHYTLHQTSDCPQAALFQQLQEPHPQTPPSLESICIEPKSHTHIRGPCNPPECNLPFCERKQGIAQHISVSLAQLSGIVCSLQEDTARLSQNGPTKYKPSRLSADSRVRVTRARAVNLRDAGWAQHRLGAEQLLQRIKERLEGVQRTFYELVGDWEGFAGMVWESVEWQGCVAEIGVLRYETGLLRGLLNDWCRRT